MTLSNFDWTDKDSVKWFILLPSGHEGPYTFEKLTQLREKGKIADDVKIWTEGLGEPILLIDALKKFEPEPPSLPPLPEDMLPPLPFESEREEPEESKPEIKVEKKKVSAIQKKPFPKWIKILTAALVVIALTLGVIINKLETFDVHRMPKMTVNLHERILKENSFSSWDKKIFLKEYISDDHTHIWLVTSSFQQCDVEATFSSLPDKMLSKSDERVVFKSKGRLTDHVVELSSFDFTTGNKIIPGMYEMDVRATNCEWDGFVPKVMNQFNDPDKGYAGRTKVVLFSKGAKEFAAILDRLVKEKTAREIKEQSQNELFWQTLQQKLETLQAVTLQVEQLFLDFLDKNPEKFKENLKPMIEEYTRQFGSFLTSFVIENENYFKNINPEAKGASQKRNYELMVKLTSKKIGFNSMKFIEEFQDKKTNPTQQELEAITGRLKKIFSEIKYDISQKIIQVSEDRSQ